MTSNMDYLKTIADYPPEPTVDPVPFDTKCGYFKRICHWLVYTKKWKVSKDWYFRLYNGVIIKIPKGFVTDGASVPKLFRALLTPSGILFVAGIIHDYAYRNDKLMGMKTDTLGNFTEEFDFSVKGGREYWDFVFMKTGVQTSGLYVIPRLAYCNLLVFGWIAWNRYRKKELDHLR